jgi:hypothetical protein
MMPIHLLELLCFTFNDVCLLFKLEEKFFRKSFNIFAMLGPTMLASISKVAQKIELSYEPHFWALGGLWTRPCQFRNVYNNHGTPYTSTLKSLSNEIAPNQEFI